MSRREKLLSWLLWLTILAIVIVIKVFTGCAGPRTIAWDMADQYRPEIVAAIHAWYQHPKVPPLNEYCRGKFPKYLTVYRTANEQELKDLMLALGGPEYKTLKTLKGFFTFRGSRFYIYFHNDVPSHSGIVIWETIRAMLGCNAGVYHNDYDAIPSQYFRDEDSVFNRALDILEEQNDQPSEETETRGMPGRKMRQACK
jgi:hypothetical protein